MPDELCSTRRLRAKLAIAAMMNAASLHFPGVHRNPDEIRKMLAWQAEDYFKYDPLASSQFDQADVMQYVETEELGRLIEMLDEMGKNTFSSMLAPLYVEDEKGVYRELWELFIEETGRLLARAMEKQEV